MWHHQGQSVIFWGSLKHPGLTCSLFSNLTWRQALDDGVLCSNLLHQSVCALLNRLVAVLPTQLLKQQGLSPTYVPLHCDKLSCYAGSPGSSASSCGYM